MVGGGRGMISRASFSGGNKGDIVKALRYLTAVKNN